MVVNDGDDFVAFLVFMARVANAIAPFLATVLVPSPWRIVKDLFRNTKEQYDDLVMEIACALHNFRVDCRRS